MKKFLFLVSLFALASCSGRPHPKMLSFTPASVVIDYSDNDLHEATQMAQQFCSSIERDAQYVRTQTEGWVMTTRHAFFNCVERGASRHAPNNSNGPNPVINNFK